MYANVGNGKRGRKPPTLVSVDGSHRVFLEEHAVHVAPGVELAGGPRYVGYSGNQPLPLTCRFAAREFSFPNSEGAFRPFRAEGYNPAGVGGYSR